MYIDSRRNIYIYTRRRNSTGRHCAVEQGKTRVVEIPSHVSRITSVHSFYGRACVPIGVVFRTRNEVRGSRSRCGARRPLVELEDEGLERRWNEQEARKVENSGDLSIKMIFSTMGTILFAKNIDCPLKLSSDRLKNLR